jgi:hypothetical protein
VTFPRLACRRPPAIAGDVSIDERRQPQGLGAGPQGGDGAMGPGAEARPGRGALLGAGQQGLGAAEVGEDKGAGLALDAAGLDDRRGKAKGKLL